jgi:hypothetical protein
MPLQDDLRALANRTQAALDQSHDYFTYTKRIWRLVEDDVREGRTILFRNRLTKSRMNGQALREISDHYIANYLTTASFQHFVSLFEDFFFDLLRLWLAAHPGSLARNQLEFSAVLKAADKNEIVLAVVDKQLNEIKYKRVADWFDYLNRLVKLGCPTTDEIEALAEMKASRDILVHNRGIANPTYLAKAGSRARCQDGELLEVPEPYHRQSWELTRKMIGDIAEAAIQKA